MSAEVNMYPPRMVADLSNSGLTPGDVRAKPLGAPEKSAIGAPTGVDGYVLPYFTLEGKPLPFYRAKLYDRDKVKYLQVADQPNHMYFPPRLWTLLQELLAKKELKYIIWTEGEKKAAAAVKNGIPCVAVGGVDSWRSRTLIVPKEATIAQKASGGLSVKLPQGKGVSEGMDTVALGLQTLIDFIVKHKVPLIICYDTDAPPNNQYARYSVGVSQDVQRAAATLGFELRHRGVPFNHIRQLVLPCIDEEKTGLDDYLIDQGAKGLQSLIDANLRKKSAFPVLPNVRQYVNKKLQKSSLTRSEQMGLALALLSDLDAKGQRLLDPDADALYYFSHRDKSLTPVAFTGDENWAKTEFGRQLYRDYNIGFNDIRVLGWLATQFSAEEPIQEVRPEKVLAWRGDTLYYQINNGLVARVTKDAIDLIDNGEDGVLFEAGLIAELDQREIEQALALVKAQPMENWWGPVMETTRIKDDAESRHKELLSLLYYVSPLFYRWRGTQLPVEITWGEAGSGKSSLSELRLAILTGIPKLRNRPTDIKDWNAGLANSGALHVTDNVQLQDAGLRNQLSDEVCRLITEPSPSIEQRKLYADTALVRIPVRVVFGFTAVKQPFTNVDIIQRAIITEMDKGTDGELTYDAEWKSRHMEMRGGRPVWLAHHLLFVQHMLQVIKNDWNPQYKARYRLINTEQLLCLAAKVVGVDGLWIPGYLEATRDRSAQESDWTLEGLVAFAEHHKRRFKSQAHRAEFTLTNIAEWAEQQEEFKGCQLLIQPRNLRRYVDTHKHMVAQAAGIVAGRKVGQSTQYYNLRESG